MQTVAECVDVDSCVERRDVTRSKSWMRRRNFCFAYGPAAMSMGDNDKPNGLVGYDLFPIACKSNKSALANSRVRRTRQRVASCGFRCPILSQNEIKESTLISQRVSCVSSLRDYHHPTSILPRSRDFGVNVQRRRLYDGCL